LFFNKHRLTYRIISIPSTAPCENQTSEKGRKTTTTTTTTTTTATAAATTTTTTTTTTTVSEILYNSQTSN
jgi:hypothetical protein